MRDVSDSGERPGADKMLTDEEKTCENCGRLVAIKKAQAEGMGMLELALGPGRPCASCRRNPGIGAVAGIMAAMGAEPEDNWIPVDEGDRHAEVHPAIEPG